MENSHNPLLFIMKVAQEQGASDVHLGGHTGLQVRIDGDIAHPDVSNYPEILSWVESLPSQPELAIKAITDLFETHCDTDDRAAFLREEALDVLKEVSACIEGRQTWDDQCLVLRLKDTMGTWRITLYQSDMGSVGVALRAQPSSIPDLNQLFAPGLHGTLGSVLRAMTQRERGLILVSGATGSGKSTLLAAMVNQINATLKKMIVTLEDPVEYWHSSRLSVVRHRQVGLDTPSFAAGLKTALRQDPDVILIGELRDLETIELALRAAETGHLVLATVHARDVSSTVSRVVEVFPAEQQAMICNQLGSSLTGIISQELRADAKKKIRLPVCETLLMPAGPGGPRTVIRDRRFQELTSSAKTNKDSNYISSSEILSFYRSSGYSLKGRAGD